MKAVAVIVGKRNSAQLIEVERLRPSKKEVLVRVLKVAVDGTDIEINKGLYGEAPAGSDYLILGHEAVGQVEEVGARVNDFKPGELVVATVRRPCVENCPNCRRGEVDMCLTGNYRERGIKGLHGYMTEYYVEKSEYLIKVPSTFNEIGVFVEPLSVAEKAIRQSWKIQERMIWNPKKALVLGAGPLGFLATLVLRYRDIETYTLATRRRDSLKAQLVEESGASYINAKEEPIRDLPKRLGRIDFILEATGNSTVAFEAMSILGTNGVLCLTGVSSGSKVLEICADCLNLQIVLGNKVVFGTVNSNLVDFKQAVSDLQKFEERWPSIFKRSITKRFPLEGFGEALKKDREGIKAIIEIS